MKTERGKKKKTETVDERERNSEKEEQRHRYLERERGRQREVKRERQRDKAYNYVHTCRQAPAYTSIITDYNFFNFFTRLDAGEDRSTERKTRHVYCFEKRKVKMLKVRQSIVRIGIMETSSNPAYTRSVK